eukprot:scaffold4120_cov400-Prasinococcus_capsulatus_cf.AAC.22
MHLIKSHDAGGVERYHGPIDRTEHNFQLWEKRTDAIFCICASKGLMNVDQLRRGIEALPEHSYGNFSYYGKWAASMLSMLQENGHITRGDVEEALGTEATDEEVKFKVGDRVRVREESEGGLRWKRPHLRVPGYIFGCVGTIERVCGVFTNPEAHAFPVSKLDPPGVHPTSHLKQPLYRVRFLMQHVWHHGYNGNENDTCDVEIYQNWLDKTATGLDAPQGARRDLQEKLHTENNHGSDDEITGKKRKAEHFQHDHNNQGHEHAPRTDVEQVAVDKEGEDTASHRLSEALLRIVVKKGIITPEELVAMVTSIDSFGADAEGARLVVKAWTDPKFRDLLLSDARKACIALGIAASNNTASTVLTAVENTETVHNVVVCTLCSCYPRNILGMAPDWYKSRSYRSRVIINPREVLREFGTEFDPGSNVEVRVNDSTADLRYMVVPMQPSGTRGWPEEDLRQLVTRDSLIGVTRAHSPDPALFTKFGSVRLPNAAKAFIFDCDGTLVDSNRLHLNAYKEVFAKYGLAFDARRVAELFGASSREILATISKEQGKDVDVEAMSLMKKDVYESTLPSVKRIESTFKVVEAAFAAKIPMAVVSGCRNVRKQWTF